MLGLFAFFYGTLHFFTWSWLDQFFDWNGMLKDVVKRPFITVGFTAFVLMIPLALTSTTGWIRRLGGKRWNRLHQLIYITAILGVIHYYWGVKADTQRPIRYGVIIGILLLARLVYTMRQKPAPARAVIVATLVGPSFSSAIPARSIRYSCPSEIGDGGACRMRRPAPSRLTTRAR